MQQAAKGIIKRQVFDLPAEQVEVTGHRVEKKFCTCCQKQVTAAFPFDGIKGISVHGHWRPYYQMPDVKHALKKLDLINVLNPKWNDLYQSIL